MQIKWNKTAPMNNVTIKFLKFKLLPFQKTLDPILNLIHHLWCLSSRDATWKQRHKLWNKFFQHFRRAYITGTWYNFVSHTHYLQCQDNFKQTWFPWWIHDPGTAMRPPPVTSHLKTVLMSRVLELSLPPTSGVDVMSDTQTVSSQSIMSCYRNLTHHINPDNGETPTLWNVGH
jgi:hypothetical protein